MTWFVLLAVVLGVISVAWLTRALWRPSTTLAMTLAVFVFAVAGLGYVGIGSPAHLALVPGAAQPPASAAAQTPTAEQVVAMVDQLAERMKSQPDNAEGWLMLGRSYVALGKHADAVAAYRKASALRPSDANLLADFAYALAMANQRNLQGEPLKLIDRALAIDAVQPKALALAGTAAFDRRDYALAVKYWEKLAQTQPPDSAFGRQVQPSIAEARRLGGMSAPVAAPTAPGAAASSAQVSGTVTLAAALKGKVSPNDTVFVFARAVDGPRMPLAILRKQVKDLPLNFTLDDSMAMSPQATLSAFPRVIVGARISKQGVAMPQAGDLQGFTMPAAVGARGLKVEINEEIGR